MTDLTDRQAGEKEYGDCALDVSDLENIRVAEENKETDCILVRGPFCWGCSDNGKQAMREAMLNLPVAYVKFPAKFDVFRLSNDWKLSNMDGAIHATRLQKVGSVTLKRRSLKGLR